MKIIQWYPGHMARAMRMMADNLKYCDAVVFVLDARAPAATYNRRLTELAGCKPVLYVLNKGDLADAKSDELLAVIKAGGRNAVKIDANAQAGIRTLRGAMSELVKEKTERLKEKGSKKPVRFMIAGVPNTGKSTLINRLAGANKAVTAIKRA